MIDADHFFSRKQCLRLRNNTILDVKHNPAGYKIGSRGRLRAVEEEAGPPVGSVDHGQRPPEDAAVKVRPMTRFGGWAHQHQRQVFGSPTEEKSMSSDDPSDRGSYSSSSTSPRRPPQPPGLGSLAPGRHSNPTIRKREGVSRRGKPNAA